MNNARTVEITLKRVLLVLTVMATVGLAGCAQVGLKLANGKLGISVQSDKGLSINADVPLKGSVSGALPGGAPGAGGTLPAPAASPSGSPTTGVRPTPGEMGQSPLSRAQRAYDEALAADAVALKAENEAKDACAAGAGTAAAEHAARQRRSSTFGAVNTARTNLQAAQKAAQA